MSDDAKFIHEHIEKERLKAVKSNNTMTEHLWSEIELLEIKWIIFVDFMLGKDMRGMKRKYRDFPFNVEEVIRECTLKLSQERKTIRAKKPK